MTNSKWGRGGSALALSALCVACGSSPGTGAAGELGAGTFTYDCEGATDLKCSQTEAADSFQVRTDLGTSEGLPKAVAVGATFGLSYAGVVREDGDILRVEVEPATPKDELGADVFRLDQPVEAAFIATDSDGRAVDFVVLEALEATSLSVWRSQDELSSLTLSVGEAAELTVVPTSEGGTFLAGALPYTWASSDAAVVSLGSVGSTPSASSVKNKGDIEILAGEVGATIVRVRFGDLEASVQVEVVP